MAKVTLEPIGSARSAEASEDSTEAHKLAEKLEEAREKTRQGWGEKYHERVRDKGKLPTWERVEKLADDPRDIYPVLTFVNHGETYGEGERTSPSAGVVTAFVMIQGRWTVVIANDNSVASGSWWPQTPQKIIRAQEIAARLRIPVVYLVDCSGLFLPEQARTFPGQRDAGHIFAKNAELSDAGVPQIAGVFGDCIAGGGYMPLISDRVIMTEKAYMVIAGAALIKGAKSQALSSIDIGGADVHVHLSRCADERVPDDDALLQRIREVIAELPGTAIDYYRRGTESAPPQYETSEIKEIVPTTPTEPYEVREVLARVVDDSMFWEVMPDVGPEVITGVARISGLYVGIVANEQGLTEHPEKPGEKRPGGILYREGVARISTFSRACNDDGIPIIWLQDISGFDIGVEAERQGLLGYGSSLIYSNTTNTTPMITVLLRKASGAGYYAMAGLPYEPVLQLSTPLTRLSVMEGRTLAIGAYNSKLDENFNIDVEDPEEHKRIAAGMKSVEERIEQDMDPFASASQMATDEIIQFDELRQYLSVATELCYQSIGHRRIKNPRIWSLHDLDIIRRQRS